MRGKIVLIYQSEKGKALCGIASQVLAEIAVAFGHTLTLPVKRCDGAPETVDTLLEMSDGAAAFVAVESSMACLPVLAEEFLCACRVRELRYAHLIENQSLMGRDRPLSAVLVQALKSDMDALRMTAAKAYAISLQDSLPISQVPPAGKLAESWKTAVDGADSLSAPFHARELPLPQVIPDMVYRPGRLGVVLCPPYAGSILLDAAAALSGAEGMCYDEYAGGQCPLYALPDQTGEEANPFGLLRVIYHVLRGALRLEREAACVEAAIRNVLQAGWRTPDIIGEASRLMTAAGIAELICQQIEVAGDWIAGT